ncbi:hypothetical protein FN846DRAFT_889011 [Sphaerosporella brunnea]|uniref:Uncharacterized protein n=1 Tax=Sphaerosporella brunnea TaxID=1250544 RepID=A0A5J5F1A8_9PEZI|nr:hypothetical protein FN846DRAFT_889011 [Sphaerosporella brunnea]
MICQINRKISGTSRSGIDPRQEKQSPSTLQKNNLNSRTIQETKNASNQLHGILCNFPMLQCNCHSLHLRLDFNTQASSPTEGKQFSFLMTSTTHKDACTDSEDSVVHLVFARNDGKAPNANIPCIGISEPCATLCKELLPLSNPYERFFPAPNSGSDSGFVLRRKVDTTADSITSLANMLSNLIPGDCYQIALNLTHSVLLHYSSPWLRDWTLDTIRFVKNHGSLKPTWTPHLTVSFSGATNQHQFGCQNREVYSLGLILLQVGRKRPLDSIKDSPQALQTAVDELCGMVGLRYRKVVWNCLYKWNDNRIDLMDEEHIRCFWADICELQSLVSEFVYGVS